MTCRDILQKLVEFPTYETDGAYGCAEFISNELNRLGFSVSIDELHNVFGTKEYSVGDGAFLISSHLDTVPPSAKWTRDPLHLLEEGDRLYGLGTSDAKGGVASMLHALQDVNQSRFRKLEVLISNYEEIATIVDGKRWLGSPYFLAHDRVEARTGINLDGTVQGDRFAVSLGCGGRVAFDITTFGKEAHTSEPSWRTMGHNAIYDMIKVIEALRMVPSTAMTIDDCTVHTELNVSTIHGGTRINVLPGECKVECERRVLPNEDWDEVKKQVEHAFRTLQDIEFKIEYYEPQRSSMIDRTDPAVELAITSVQRTLGYTPKFRVIVGITDSAYLDRLAGVKTLMMGPGDPIVEHKPDEWVSSKRIEEFSRVFRCMLAKENPAQKNS
jgi:acetylornithine deacetylase/succinyl-diaminopimelate desuccinylase-like protein